MKNKYLLMYFYNYMYLTFGHYWKFHTSLLKERDRLRGGKTILKLMRQITVGTEIIFCSPTVNSPATPSGTAHWITGQRKEIGENRRTHRQQSLETPPSATPMMLALKHSCKIGALAFLFLLYHRIPPQPVLFTSQNKLSAAATLRQSYLKSVLVINTPGRDGSSPGNAGRGDAPQFH